MTSRNRKIPRWHSVAILLLLSAAGVAHATDWVYRVRLHDNIWDLAGRYVKPGIPWQKLQDYNKVVDPYHLPPGMRFRIPIDWLSVQPANAKVVAVFGSAHAQIGGQSPALDVSPGMSLGYGAHLSTDAGASLTLEFADGSRLLMEQDSVLDLDRMSAYGRTGMVDTRVRLQRGRVSNSVTPMTGAAAHFSVETPGTVSSVRGTHFRVAADASSGRSQTEVITGLVDVAGHRQHRLVARGFGSTSADDIAPGKARTLLPAPTLACPAEPLSQSPYTLNWQPVTGASHYRVQIAANDRFEALVKDLVVDAPHLDLPELRNGTYALRVRASDADQLEGSDALCVVNIIAYPKPPLIIEPQADSTARGTRPRFRWTETAQASSYRWQLARDPEFTQLIEDQPSLSGSSVRASHSLAYGRYYWRIAANASSGSRGPFSQPIPFELAQELPPPEVGKPAHDRHSMRFAWEAGEPQQRFHVQISRDPQFGKLLIDQTVDQPVLEIHKPASGTWYVRVQTVASDGYTGPWGPTQKTRLPCIACRVAAVAGGAALVLVLL